MNEPMYFVEWNDADKFFHQYAFDILDEARALADRLTTTKGYQVEIRSVNNDLKLDK